jgi:hypothetical protein
MVARTRPENLVELMTLINDFWFVSMMASNIGYSSKPFSVLAREFLVSQSGKGITVIHNCFDVPTPCCLLGSNPSVKVPFPAFYVGLYQ